MKKLFTLLLVAACFTALAQIEVEYPYNPDNQNDGHVGIEDILEILTVYGEEFTPEQLIVEGTSLTEWIQLLSETVIQQQAQIDSLEVVTEGQFFADSLFNTLAAHLDQQQSQIDSLTSLNPTSQFPSFDLECVDMGVASNCFGQMNWDDLTPSNNYTYSISGHCSTQWTESIVAPTWRLFKVSGLDPSVSSVRVGYRYWYESNSSGGIEEFRVSVGSTAEVVDGEFQFVLFSSNTYMVHSGLWPSGVSGFNVSSDDSGGSNAWSRKTHIELLVELNGAYIDTGIRLTP